MQKKKKPRKPPKGDSKEPKWSERKKRFCEHYVVCLVGAEAARRAGYAEEFARQRAWELLQEEPVKKYLEELRQDWSERTGITRERVLQELAIIGYSNMSDFARWNSSGVDLKDTSLVDPAVLPAVKKVKYSMSADGAETSIELHDKKAALDKIGQHLGLWKNVVEHEHKVTLEDLVSGSLEEKDA